MRRTLLLLLDAALVGPGCDRTPGGASTNTPTTAGTASEQAPHGDAFVSGEGTGASNDEALAAAREALLATLLGGPGWAELAEIDLASSQAATTFEPVAEGRVRARIDLTRVGAAALLTAFESAEPEVVGPAAWRDVLYGFLRAHIAAQACDQRRQLFAATCDAGDTSDVDDALAELITEVELAPPFPDGVPADATGRPVRPASVYVLWRGLPVADVPVVATASVGAAPLRANSDAHGVAVVAPVGDPAWSVLDVGLDTARLLGPLRGAWPERGVRLEPRSIDPRRWVLAVAQSDGALADAIEARLKRGGASDPAPLTARVAQEIAGAEGDARARRVSALADASSGRIDFVLVASAASRFAGRMGSSKAWAEATGRVDVHDAWTGRVIATIEETATASGLGDDRAKKAALDELAGVLADRVLASPELRFAAR